MAFCGNCGKQVDDGVKFCPSCGTSMSGAPVKAEAQAGDIQADPNDAEQNKGMAIISYLGILCLIPLLTGDYKKSEFLKFHTNQGFVLFISAAALWIASLILGAIFTLMHLWAIVPLFSTLVWLGILALIILGIINVVNGRMRPLPVIGKFTIIK
jgi:uncharacterized membrane protein